jgi:hypothetical protein
MAKTTGFIDPLTGLPPSSERTLSCILAFHCQRQAILWSKVNLYNVDNLEPVGAVDTIISYPGYFVTEYLLLHKNKDQEAIWGGMPVDLLYASRDLSRVVMFENKIGSDFQYEVDPKTSQLARQLDYLLSIPNSARHNSLVLLTSRDFLAQGWYKNEFSDALRYNNRNDHVSGFVVLWEEVISSFAGC